MQVWFIAMGYLVGPLSLQLIFDHTYDTFNWIMVWWVAAVQNFQDSKLVHHMLHPVAAMNI